MSDQIGERAAVLRGLYAALGREMRVKAFADHLRIQKEVYLVRLHPDLAPLLPFDFDMYIRGPYSTDLADAYYAKARPARVEVTARAAAYAGEVLGMDPRTLELAATLAMFCEYNKRFPEFTAEEGLELLLERKSWATEGDARRALEVLRNLVAKYPELRLPAPCAPRRGVRPMRWGEIAAEAARLVEEAGGNAASVEVKPTKPPLDRFGPRVVVEVDASAREALEIWVRAAREARGRGFILEVRWTRETNVSAEELVEYAVRALVEMEIPLFVDPDFDSVRAVREARKAEARDSRGVARARAELRRAPVRAPRAVRRGRAGDPARGAARRGGRHEAALAGRAGRGPAHCREARGAGRRGRERARARHRHRGTPGRDRARREDNCGSRNPA